MLNRNLSSCIISCDTRIGARALNQDRLGHWRTPQCLLMVVADGLGGHERGELAAELAVDYFGALFRELAQPALADAPRFLERACAGAHRLIVRQAARLGLAELPRTVLAACVVQDGEVHWTHVGDCRVYLVREGRVVARTRDHTRVQELVDAGEIDPALASVHPERNRLLQCLGSVVPPRLEPPRRARLAPNDVLLLCSDGLWAPLEEAELVAAAQSRDFARAIAALAAQAERRAGSECDNVSVLAMRWQ